MSEIRAPETDPPTTTPARGEAELPVHKPTVWTYGADDPRLAQLPGSVIEFGVNVAETLLLDLITDYITSKIKGHFDEKEFKKRMKALLSDIHTREYKVRAGEKKKLRVPQSKQLYWIVELGITTTNFHVGRRRTCRERRWLS